MPNNGAPLASTLGRIRDYIATEIRAEMGRQGTTQRELGAVLDLPQDSISRRLNGKRSFRAEELAAVADALHVPVTQFLPVLERVA